MTNSRTVHARHRTQLLGAIGLTVIVAVSGFLIATYQRAFADVVQVTVQTDRGGLLLDRGARVRMSGVPVGEVRRTEVQDDGTVEVSVAIDTDKSGLVPADAVASIRATTVFGAKYVDLRRPSESSGGRPIEEGAVLTAEAVTVEVNDVFQHGLSVLEAVDPTKLNATLASASTALEGRGDELGGFFSDWDGYLATLEPHLSALESDLAASSDVLETYADVAPQLIDTGDNLATTSGTLVARRKDLGSLLTGTVAAADATSRLLSALEGPLLAFNEQWLDVTRLGNEYAPVIGCLIDSIHNHIDVFAGFFGGTKQEQHYYYIKTGFLPGQDPYTLEKNRPKLVTGVGPVCYPEATAENPTPPHINFDDGTAGTYSEENAGRPVDVTNPVKVYTDLVDDWFGSDVTGLLLDARTKDER